MYLSTHYPEALSVIESYGYGLWTPKVDGSHKLVIKASKEVILTAKINKGFHFYLAPVQFKSESSLAVMTIFFDDDDSPLFIATPLLRDDSFTENLLEFFKQDDFEVFFFDENNRELLSYKAIGNLAALSDRISGIQLLGIEAERAMGESAQLWFSKRTEADDDEAIEVRFTESLFRDDFVILDMGIDRHTFLGSKSFSHTSLVRTEPGHYQEQDIVFLLQRTFDPSKIYLNPVKAIDGEEFVDVMVLGENALFLIQAKDSPNTEKMLRNTLDRKRRKSISQLKDGLGQLEGAVSFVNNDPLLLFDLDGELIKIDVSGKPIVGIVIVKELFNDSFEEYSKLAFEFVEKRNVYTAFFDFSDFNLLTLHCKMNEAKFEGVFVQIWEAALEHGEFPRLRFSGKPG